MPDPRAILLTLSGIPEALKKHQSAKEKLQEMESKLKGELGLLQYEAQINLKKGLQQGKMSTMRDLIGLLGDPDLSIEGRIGAAKSAKKLGEGLGFDMSPIDALMKPGAYVPPEKEGAKGLAVGQIDKLEKGISLAMRGQGEAKGMFGEAQPIATIAAGIAARTGRDPGTVSEYEASWTTFLNLGADPMHPRAQEALNKVWERDVKRFTDGLVANDIKTKKKEMKAKAKEMGLAFEVFVKTYVRPGIERMVRAAKPTNLPRYHEE